MADIAISFDVIYELMLVHHMTLVSFRLFCKNLGKLREFLDKWFTTPTPTLTPWQKIARTSMLSEQKRRRAPGTKTAHLIINSKA